LKAVTDPRPDKCTGRSLRCAVTTDTGMACGLLPRLETALESADAQPMHKAHSVSVNTMRQARVGQSADTAFGLDM
jgi:hypothetical protein